MISEEFSSCQDKDNLRIFVTFGDGDFRYRRSASRLATQIEKFEIYDLTFALNRKWLKNVYPEIYSSIIQNARNFPVKGFGYWVWKYCALEYLGHLYPNSVVHYADAGHSAPNSKETYTLLERCLNECLTSGYLGWELPDCREIEFTKTELCIFMKATVSALESNQMDASQFFLSAKNARNISKRVLSVYRNNFDLFLDATSLPHNQFFKQHRHDQSVLSLLWKKDWNLQQESNFEKPLEHDRNLSPYPSSYSKWQNLYFVTETFFARIEKYSQILIWRFMWRP